MEDSIRGVTFLFMDKEEATPCVCICVYKKKCVNEDKNLLLVEWKS